MLIKGKRPNFLILMNDEERFPPPYENAEAKQWRLEHSKTRLEIASHGLDLRRHYTGAIACAPSRATIFTGQYPSLHGVSQTPGLAKSSADPAMFWLDPNTVPTLGDYMRAGGYQTHYKGKWHASDADIMVPGSNNGLLSNGPQGQPYPEKISSYETANRLEGYGFNGWIGPEPHGNLSNNCGTVRDPGFAHQAARVIQRLDEQAASGEEVEPWTLVASFVNPHDIVFSGPLMKAGGWFSRFYEILANNPELLPKISLPPTFNEALQSKPRAQQDYVLQYPRMYMPQPVDETYFQLYYWLMAEADKNLATVYDALKASSFFENTIVVLTADHGDLLGAHGGMQQKWCNAYEEAIHVPMIVSNPLLFPEPKVSELLTSHLDLIPTILGLADIDQEKARAQVSLTHTEAQKLVGRDLSSIVKDAAAGKESTQDEAVYFMTDDQVSKGLQQVSGLGESYRTIIQPSSVETALTRMPDANGAVKLWKISRYFDNPRYSTGIFNCPGNGGIGNPDAPYTDQASEVPLPDEWECYNMSDDLYEENNLLSPLCKAPLALTVETQLKQVLREQSIAKRKLPHNSNRTISPPDLGTQKIAVDYNPFIYPATGTASIQGVRGIDGSREVYICGSLTGTGSTTETMQGFLYFGPLKFNGAAGSWSVFNYTSTDFSDVDNTSCYGPNLAVNGDVQVVGSYKRTSTGNHALGFYYQGPADGSGTWTTISPNDGNTNNVYVHSIMGGLAVGNYDVDGLDNGFAFIYDIHAGSFDYLVAPNALTTTVYGIWHNGGTRYTLAGGYSEDAAGDLSQAFLVDWDCTTKTASNWKSYQYQSETMQSIVTHFEGINSDDDGTYTLAADWLNAGQGAGAALAKVKRNKDGTFGDASWVDIAYPGSTITTANTVYKNWILGIVASSSDGTGDPSITTESFLAEVGLG